MEPCHVQGFVCIDVAQPGQEGLVKQERFELPVLGVQRRVQPGWGKFIGERLGPKVPEDFGGVIHQPDPSELARVRKNERHVIRQF